MELIIKFIIIGVILIAFIVFWVLAVYFEKKSFNNGICPYCNTKLNCFDMDSQGGRGYTCKRCDYTTWVSYPSVDKDFEDDNKVFKKKKIYSSKIESLIYDEDSVVLFDIDGVLAKYEFGEHNHNLCSDEEWDNNVEYYAPTIYDSAKPVELFQRLIRNKKPGTVYTCSVAKGDERYAKISFVRRFYDIPEENILFVESKDKKLFAMEATRLQKRMQGFQIPDEKFIMVDDSVKVLTHIQENSNFSTCHVSSFLE